MKGVLKIGEAQKGFMENSVTATFYRLEKLCKGACSKYYDVYEFYKVKKNGNMYYAHHEENVSINRLDGYNYKDVQLGFGEEAKEKCNQLYKELLSKGYKFVGIYESDIFRYARRIA